MINSPILFPLGGPLLYPSEDKLFIVAILSRCFSNDNPAQSPIVFTLVQPYMDWIKSHVADDRCSMMEAGQSIHKRFWERYQVQLFIVALIAILVLLIRLRPDLKVLDKRTQTPPPVDSEVEEKKN